jgi:hypothetical protein
MTRRLWRPVGLAALLAPPLCASAQSNAGFHWGYSATFGTGTYRLPDGSEVDVYRANFVKRLRDTPDEPGSGPGVRLLLPVAAGARDPLDDPLTVGVTEPVGQVAFVPGVELEFAAGERWTLRTEAQLGRAAALGDWLHESGETARLGAAGVRSRFVFPDVAGRPALINGLLWAGVESSEGERSSLVRLTNGLEFTVDTPRWRVRDSPMHLMPHVLHDSYYRPPSSLALGDSDGSAELDSVWQVGVAAGREGGFKIGFIKFQNVGIAYRFSDLSRGLRFYLNSVF